MKISEVQNEIYYLYNKNFDKRSDKQDIYEALEAFNIKCCEIESNNNYIEEIFKIISDKTT